jgi:hypothetical protein
MASLHDLQAARARQSAQRELEHAEAALAEIRSQSELSSGIGINLALINRVRAAEERVATAREKLQAMMSPGIE